MTNPLRRPLSDDLENIAAGGGGGSGGLENVLDTTVEADIENIDTLDFSRGTVIRPLLTDADFENELSTRTFETGDESNWTKISQGQGTTVTHTVTNTKPLNGSFSWEMEAQGSSSAPQQLITQTNFSYSTSADLFVADKSVYIQENESGEVASVISAFFESAGFSGDSLSINLRGIGASAAIQTSSGTFEIFQDSDFTPSDVKNKWIKIRTVLRDTSEPVVRIEFIDQATGETINEYGRLLDPDFNVFGNFNFHGLGQLAPPGTQNPVRVFYDDATYDIGNTTIEDPIEGTASIDILENQLIIEDLGTNQSVSGLAPITDGSGGLTFESPSPLGLKEFSSADELPDQSSGSPPTRTLDPNTIYRPKGQVTINSKLESTGSNIRFAGIGEDDGVSFDIQEFFDISKISEGVQVQRTGRSIADVDFLQGGVRLIELYENGDLESYTVGDSENAFSVDDYGSVQSNSVSLGNAKGFTITEDGNYIIIADRANNELVQYELTDGSNQIGTLSQVKTLSVNGVEPVDVEFNQAEDTMYVLIEDSSAAKIEEWTGGSPNDITTYTYQSSTNLELPSVESLKLNRFPGPAANAEEYLYIVGDGELREYFLSTAGDISTLSLEVARSPTTAMPKSIRFNADGSKFVEAGVDGSDSVLQNFSPDASVITANEDVKFNQCDIDLKSSTNLMNAPQNSTLKLRDVDLTGTGSLGLIDSNQITADLSSVDFIDTSSVANSGKDFVEAPTVNEITLQKASISSQGIIPGFGMWRQVSSERPGEVSIDATAQTDGSTEGKIIVEVDESGGTSADYSLTVVNSTAGFSGGTDVEGSTSVKLPPGAQYRVVNTSDPNGSNQIDTVREFTF